MMHVLAFIVGFVAGLIYILVDPRLPSLRRRKPQQREPGTTSGIALWTIAATLEDRP